MPRRPGAAPLSAIRAFRLADRAARICPNEGDDVVNWRNPSVFPGHLVDTLDERPFSREQVLIGAAQSADVFATEPAALHADDVEPVEPCAVAHYLAVGNDVPLDARHAPNHGMAPDPHELVYRAETAQHRVVFNDHMTGQLGIVRHHYPIANLTVVSDVNPDHEQRRVADAGHHAPAGRARVHHHVFADRVVAADLEERFLAAVFEVLRLEADRGEGKDARPDPDRRSTINDDVGAQAD